MLEYLILLFTENKDHEILKLGIKEGSNKKCLLGYIGYMTIKSRHKGVMMYALESYLYKVTVPWKKLADWNFLLSNRIYSVHGGV